MGNILEQKEVGHNIQNSDYFSMKRSSITEELLRVTYSVSSLVLNSHVISTKLWKHGSSQEDGRN